MVILRFTETLSRKQNIIEILLIVIYQNTMVQLQK